MACTCRGEGVACTCRGEGDWHGMDTSVTSGSLKFSPHKTLVLDAVYDYVQAILNPLQGMLNALAYGGVWQLCSGCLKQRLVTSMSCSHETRGYSWSREYIDVDFRVGRGRIHSKRSQTKTPSETRSK